MHFLIAGVSVLFLKGYPDVGTREFIRALSSAHRRRGQDLPIFIVTDADPHGISIANCYVQSLLECSVKWLGVCPSHNGQLFNVRQSSLLGITERENAILRGLLKGWDDSKMHADALTLLISEAKHLQNAQVKFEMEALASELGRANVSGLTIYITERVREFQFGQGR